ncbi:glycosyl hydrolase [Mycena polygramma]|nr:glycosyl hydrolase [Mycena polygramma]
MLRTLLYVSWPVLVVATCSFDQTSPPVDLTSCPDSSLFSVWRPRARFIAPEGWQNDPQGLYQRSDGSYHAGYQCHPNHYTWGNISQCAATSKDFVYWEDSSSSRLHICLSLHELAVNGWENPNTIWPSQIFDIRGVFDGSIMKNGYNGFPTPTKFPQLSDA